LRTAVAARCGVRRAEAESTGASGPIPLCSAACRSRPLQNAVLRGGSVHGRQPCDVAEPDGAGPRAGPPWRRRPPLPPQPSACAGWSGREQRGGAGHAPVPGLGPGFPGKAFAAPARVRLRCAMSPGDTSLSPGGHATRCPLQGQLRVVSERRALLSLPGSKFSRSYCHCTYARSRARTDTHGFCLWARDQGRVRVRATRL
jgi:hypothetical protein